MNGEITFLPTIYTVLIVGAGYVVILIKFKFKNDFISKDKQSDFYKMNTYDKAIQGLIAGVIVIAITCFLSGTSYDLFNSPDNFLKSRQIIPFLLFQFGVIFYTGTIWGMVEVLIIHKNYIKKRICELYNNKF